MEKNNQKKLKQIKDCVSVWFSFLFKSQNLDLSSFLSLKSLQSDFAKEIGNFVIEKRNSDKNEQKDSAQSKNSETLNEENEKKRTDLESERTENVGQSPAKKQRVN